jgi:hypothetical protein
MNFHWPFARKPEHSPLPDRSSKGQFIVSPKTRERMSKATEIRCQLAVYKATTTPEQRLADYEAWRRQHAPIPEAEAVRRATARGMWAGYGGPKP